ncbi:uncharacterized protein TNCV_2429581 [Trichonephila clavipes]|nr:uncharacterized protein TNCV_2429581 [Trichonephila clavipes]
MSVLTGMSRLEHDEWIGYGVPVLWTHRSPDLLTLKYFLCGYLRNIVHETQLDSDEDLIARISEASARVREVSGILECIRQLHNRRCQACIAIDRRDF